MMLLFWSQRRSWLVEYDDFSLETHSPRDFDHLPLGGAERLDARRRVNRKVQRLKELLCFDIDAPEAIEEFLIAEIEVLRDRHRGHETGLLIDHRNAVSPS